MLCYKKSTTNLWKIFFYFYKNEDSQSCILFLRPTDSFEKCIYNTQKIIKKIVEKMSHKKNISKFLHIQIKNELITISFQKQRQPHIDFITY